MTTAATYCTPWPADWRNDAWESLDTRWDIVIIGGGITGAGIFALAARMGLKVVLVEQNDFASGTSSRSSKLVHGGLRYLKQMQFALTRESVRERESLCKTVPGLVEKMGFIYPVYRGDIPPAILVELGLNIYTHLARGTGGYRRLNKAEIGTMVPGLTLEHLRRGFRYTDAWTDDARLVIRVIHDSLCAAPSAIALNYTRMEHLIRSNGMVSGVAVRDIVANRTKELTARVVINATGAWADGVRGNIDLPPRLRPLRGSHLYFNRERLPLYQAISFIHPDDKRFLFAYPWEHVTLVGTTDIDHTHSLDAEPVTSSAEYDYIMSAVLHRFPDRCITDADVVSTQAGVRPVINTGKRNPSSESREHVVWKEKGLITVTGGKLTTFEKIAYDALGKVHALEPSIPRPPKNVSFFSPEHGRMHNSQIDASVRRRMIGRYGAVVSAKLAASTGANERIPETPYYWAELAWSAAHEAIVHLDDLMLRRFRFGIVTSDGGAKIEHALKACLQKPLGWNDDRWHEEWTRYHHIRTIAHGTPQR